VTAATVIENEATLPGLTSQRSRSLTRMRVNRLLQRKLAIIGAAIIIVEVVAAIFGSRLVPYDPMAPDFVAILQPPSAAHWLGTDDLGRDILSRLLTGARYSLLISVASVTLAMIAGVFLGILSGYIGGAIDEVLMRILDSFMALPSLVLALAIAAALGPGLANAMLAIAVAAVPTYARLVRGQTLSIKENEYILAARSTGVGSWRIVGRHILPNTLGPVIVQASLGLGFAIITESSLSFIGLGIQPPLPTWGWMVQVGFQFLETAPWYVLAPASAIFLAVLGFNLLGDGLRDALDT
jgi:ABC-type dipeptide/oligopeptide/nickel transport system permease subunit